MAITQSLCTSFRAEILLAVHDFRNTGGDTFKMALYSSAATINANTTAYTASNEVSHANYTAGGQALTNSGVTATNVNASSGVGFLDFADETFSNVSITARGALIYNSTPSANGTANTTLTNAAVAVLDFGADKTATDGDFTVIFPTANSSNAIIRIA